MSVLQEYKPNRRQKQKYCSNSCRTRALLLESSRTKQTCSENKTRGKNPEYYLKLEVQLQELAVNIATIFSQETRTSNKKRHKEIKQLFITQHHHIKNMPDRYDGARPFTICKRKILFI
jgi:hypothetical protein